MIHVWVHDRGVRQLLNRARSLGANPEPIVRAMGNTLKSITEGNFNSVGAKYRPSPWPAKSDGTPSILQKSTTLAKSFFLQVDGRRAVVGSPMKYAAIHQFGGEIRPVNRDFLRFFIGDRVVFAKKVTIPARPFFPIDDNRVDSQFTPAAARLIVRAGERALARALGAQQGPAAAAA